MKYRYTLTLNSKSKEDLDDVLATMNEQNVIGTILNVDSCFGPYLEDGSFITLLSSDTLAEEGFTDAWAKSEVVAYFKNLAKLVPSSKFTLRGKPEENYGMSSFIKKFNMPWVRDKTGYKAANRVAEN